MVLTPLGIAERRYDHPIRRPLHKRSQRENRPSCSRYDHRNTHRRRIQKPPATWDVPQKSFIIPIRVRFLALGVRVTVGFADDCRVDSSRA